ncbi:MAG: primosomal protein N' [Anaerolineales bacterium]|jgi:primosomal protein N' (replication factor Y)
MFAEVAVNLPPIRGTFSYHVPDQLEARLRAGHLVLVPFGSRTLQGIVVDLASSAPVDDTRPIAELIDPQPVLTDIQLKLAHWLARETAAALIDCLTVMLPPGLSQQADSVYRLIGEPPDNGTAAEKRLISQISRRGPLRGRQLARALGKLAWRKAADRLVARGVLARESVLDPPSVRARTVRTAHLAAPPDKVLASLDAIGRTAATRSRRETMLRMLIAERQAIEVTWLYAESGGNLQDLRYLEDMGLLTLSQAEIWRDPLEAVEYVPDKAPLLTSEQQEAWEPIERAIRLRAPSKPFLLHGVTGSGKTEIYMRAVQATLESHRQAIVLTPEIALTPQTVRRFLARFPGRVGLVHSQLSEGERYDTWRRARQGELDIVIGPRSALFTPMPNLGLIVVDESHDDSYKETLRPPRYHARTASIAYAELAGAHCILGSATPDLVSSYRADHGAMIPLSLPNRIFGHTQRIERQAQRLGLKSRYSKLESDASSIRLPPVRVVDMRQELRAGNASLFSRPLTKALTETLGAGQQAILFLNRRGQSTYVFCRDCGWVANCPRCGTPMTYHPDRENLLCHHCGYARSAPATCPQCGGSRVKYFGAGTQRVESELHQHFPEAISLRWDRDTTRTKGAHDVLLAHFAAHRADVLIGTQMIAKGLDVPMVTLVGVISADTGLNLPDYRAAERTFQILTQVAGRAGRGILGGRAIIQTYQPDHYVIRAAARHDYRAFYDEELRRRAELEYPPFTRLVRFTTRDLSASKAESRAGILADHLANTIGRAHLKAEMIGPVPCFFDRIGGEYRWQIVIRVDDPQAIVPDTLPEGWSVDVDPVSLL